MGQIYILLSSGVGRQATDTPALNAMKKTIKINHASSDVASLNKVCAGQWDNQAAPSDKWTTGCHNKKQQTQTEKKGDQNTLNLMQLNICGLRNKKIELLKVLNEKNIHIALLQETLHKNSDLNLTGYTSYACTCTGCRGVITYIRNDVQGDVRHIPMALPTDMQKATVWHNGRKYTIYNVYSPPQTTCNFSALQESHFQKTLLTGDFNGHSPSWGYNDYNPSGKEIEELCETSNLSVLQNLNTTPTLLHRAHMTLSRPDLTICSSDIQHTCSIEVINDIGSDHRPIVTQIKSERKRSPVLRRTRWNFKKANWEAYRETSDILLLSLEDKEDIDHTNDTITQMILKAASQHIPRGYHKKFKPFWNDDLQTAVAEREKSRQALEKAPSPTTKTSYNKACAKVKRTVKNSKREKWTKTCNELDLRHGGTKAWNLVSNLSGVRRKENPKPIADKDQYIADDQKKAECYNSYFASVNRAGKQTMEDKCLLQNLRQKEKAPSANCSIFEEDFTLKELNRAIRKMKPKKAPGPDKVHNEMIHHLGTKGKEVLLRLFNTSWKKSQIPKAWRTALITPILKKGKPSKDPKSYRPISLTSCIGKLAERMINNRLYWYLESNNILSHRQAGFRRGSCTEDQLLKLTQEIQDGFQEGKHTAAIFVDLQQAYDRVWRKGLLTKMIDLGIHGKLYRWIKFFLTDRTIMTKVNNAFSSKEVLEEGLPQGSCLSCTLFLIFLNDLADILKSETTLYADDVALWQTTSNITTGARKLNEDLERLQNYCDKWKVKINGSKTVYTIFTKSHKIRNTNLNLKIGDVKLHREEQPTYLGVQLDSQLTLKSHVDNIKSKAKKRLQLLKKLASSSWGSDKETLRGLYLGYVRSALEYSNSLLTMCSKSTCNTLDKIQNNALRFINGAMRSTPTAACEILANVEPLGMRRDKAALEIHEKCKRMDSEHPNRKLVDTWTPRNRIQQRSVLHHATELLEKHNLPEQRQQTARINRYIPPHANMKEPQILTELRDKNTKSSDPVTLMLSSQTTVTSYPDDWIHIYTDGSAFKGTTRAGYGVHIQYPDGDSSEISEACGEKCTNYEAEMIAIETALYYLSTLFDTSPPKARSTVIFTDSQSVLQALENDSLDNQDLTHILKSSHYLISTYGIDLVMQWIPGHSNTPGNDRADKLAKRGANQEQPLLPTSIHTAKQIIKTNTKQDWMNRWAMNKTGRAVFKHVTAPRKMDNINQLARNEQSTIFRLRTQHVQLNHHLNRIQPQIPPVCPLCGFAYETVDHHLFHCPPLQDIRISLLPPRPDTENVLYGTLKQLKQTCRYHYMALDRRAKAQASLVG